MNQKMTAIDASKFLGVTVQAVHRQLKSKELDFEKSQNRVYFGHSTAKKLFKIKFKQKVLTVQIVKGGTGKTSIAHALAIRASLYGARVLCIDLDQQGNLTQAFQQNPEEVPAMVDVLSQNIPFSDAIINVTDGIDLVCSRIENAILDSTLMLKSLPLERVYRDMFDPLRKKYDLILIDCPPALGQSVAAASLASDLVVSPVTPEKFCLSGLKITSQELLNIENVYKKKIPMRIILNKFDSRTTLSHEVLSTLIKHSTYGDKMFKTYIRVSQEFANVIVKGESLFDSLKDSTAKEDIDLLTREILEIKNDSTLSKEEVSLGSLEEELV